MPVSGNGDTMHRKRGEKPCDDCRKAVNDYQRLRREQGKTKDRQYQLWSWYRLRWEEYEAILLKQDGKCAVCILPFLGEKQPHVDHDHSCDHENKGRKSCRACVRGILCQRCNTGLAVLEDPQRLDRALRYLSRG